jgi:hypothetical protein
MINKAITVGIIIMFLILSFSGCTNQNQESDGGDSDSEDDYPYIKIEDLVSNPEYFIGREITIEGKCSGGSITDESGNSIKFTSPYYLTIGNYRLTGFVEKKEYESLPDVYFLNVTSVIKI